VAEADMRPDAALVDDAVQVVEDRGPVGYRLLVAPRLEIEAERVHVAVRADAGIAEQVPGAAEVLAPLENREAAIRALHPHMRGHADARNPRAHDQHVEIGCVVGHALSPG
jgi:hypothetical protein